MHTDYLPGIEGIVRKEEELCGSIPEHSPIAGRIMKKTVTIRVVLLLLAAAVAFTAFQGQKDPWSQNQLMEPAQLATKLQASGASQPLVLNIGPAGTIKNAVDIGPMTEPENVQKLRGLLAKTDKKKEVVVYCGCCPFKNCPNVRPAFALLKEYKFQSPFLLNLSRNLKADWIDKGYPMQ